MRDETRRFVAGISLIAALVIGLFYWSRSQPASTPPLPAPEPVQEVAQASPPKPLPRIEPPKAAAKPPTQIAQTRAQPEPALIDEKPARISFPADLPAAFTSAHFHDALAQVLADCKFPYQLDEEDCSEFPCIAWGRWDLKVSKHIELTECEAWKEKFGDKVSVYLGGEDGEHYLGVVALPPGPRLPDETFKHINERANGMLESHDHRHIEINYGVSPQLRKAGPHKLTGQELAKK